MRVGINAGMRAYNDPESDVAGAFASRLREYQVLWSYYENSIFERVYADLWAVYKVDYRLARYIRSVYNPTRRLVNFYKGAVYPGSLTVDGRRLPEGVPLAIPLAQDMDPDLKEAIGQLWEWSNWQAGMRRMVGFGSALGDVAIEVVDELDREKVTFQVHWPGRITALVLDNSGNVKAGTIEYRAEEDNNATGQKNGYRFRRIYTLDGRIEEYRDETKTRDEASGYGFVPLVWIRHEDVGSDHGAPAMAGSLSKLDTLNDLVSRVYKQIAITVESPQLVATDQEITPALSDDAAAMLDDAELSLRLFAAEAGASTHTFVGNLDLGAVLEHIRDLQSEINNDHPELAMFSQLRAMSNVTGPGASRMLGDVAALVDGASGNYDAGSIKAFQMGVAIAGERFRSGAWTKRDSQQAKFAPFDLTSYVAGKLTVEIEPRPLVAPTSAERWASETARADVAAKWAEVSGSKVFGFARAGFTPEELERFYVDNARAIEAERLLAQSDVGANNEPPPAQ